MGNSILAKKNYHNKLLSLFKTIQAAYIPRNKKQTGCGPPTANPGLLEAMRKVHLVIIHILFP